MKPKETEKEMLQEPDVKNEGSVQTPKGKSWEYHCNTE